MNPNRLLLLISFLIMYQLNEAASVVKPQSSPTRENDCLNFVSTPLDFINVENFRSNVKQELKRLNCTEPGIVHITEADLENPKKDSFAISSENFCTSLSYITSWKTVNSSFPNLDHLEKKIFTNQTLCIVVCTKDLNETIWPYCEAIRNLLGTLAGKVPSKVVTKPSQPEAENNVISQPTNSEKSQKKDPANPSDSVKSLKNEPAIPQGDPADPKGDPADPKGDPADLKGDPADLKGDPADLKGDPADPANSVKSLKSDPVVPAPLDPKMDGDENMRREELNNDNLEGMPVEEIPNSAPSKTENSPDSSKKILQQGTVNASNQSGEHPPASVNVPSKSLPQTAVLAGTTNLRPENDESHYFIYFVVMSVLCIFCYIGIYNKKKILALMIEGRKQKDRRRHASAGYRKLNTNLEEVVPLGTSAPTTDSMIY